ncbi:MAG TPA: Ltp family lipoprotein [Allosphingosinicella sp.]
MATAAAALLAVGCGSGTEEAADNAAVAPQVAAENASVVGNSTAVEADGSSVVPQEGEVAEAEPERPSLTGPQGNAVRSAEQYLSISGFSRAGLIDQLSSDAGDGYSVADATAAVDSLDVDWNENAAKSARQYLSISGFSCKGLIEQLSSDAGDKYTTAQASYGARQAGAC